MVPLRVHLIGALIAAAAASAAVSIREFARATSDPGPQDVGPVVWIAQASALARPTAAYVADAENATTALALGSLSAQELEELRVGLEVLASRLEARANPFGDDLEDGPPGEEMAAVRRSLAPALTAAHHLAARTQTSADGTFAIALGASCAEAPADASCFPLWGAGSGSGSGAGAGSTPARSELRERASFFAWPIASAAVVRFSDATRAAEVLDVLRERARSPSSRISLALDERALAGGADPRVEAVRDAARKVFAQTKRGSTPELEALRPLVATPPPGRRVPWLTLGAGEIMVVPKLGGLSDPAGFARELDELLPATSLDDKARWVRRPWRSIDGGTARARPGRAPRTIRFRTMAKLAYPRALRTIRFRTMAKLAYPRAPRTIRFRTMAVSIRATTSGAALPRSSAPERSPGGGLTSGDMPGGPASRRRTCPFRWR